MEYVRIPMERLGVLIGKKGQVKKEIETCFNVKIEIDTEDGSITVENVGEDVLAEWKARDMIKAVGRGINPERAMLLKSDDYVLKIIDLSDLVGRSKKTLQRQKGRIIGRQGKTREFIAQMTGACVSVYGKTIAILGEADEVNLASEAVEMLASGKPHGVVYKVLQRKARDLKEKNIGMWK
ncbi:MAG: KH domain-containing protein [Candidatus Hydrothermarchaeales archaeon]